MGEPLPITETLLLPGDELEISTARSGGPGGQHVNTTESRVRLCFRLSRTAALSEGVKARLRRQQAGWLTTEGDLVLTCDANRSQHRNLEEVRERLAAAVRAALVPPRARKKTRPTLGSQLRRVAGKKKRGEIKRGRGRGGGGGGGGGEDG